MVTVESRTVEVWDGRIRTRVQVGGVGRPLVYLHAVFGLQWDPFLDALAASHTVYAVEHPGTTPGDPDAVKALDDLWDLVLYYYEVFDALGLERPAVVGHITWAMACTGKFFWPIPDRGLHKRLHRVTAPTLVVWGESDRIVSPAYAEDWTRAIAGARSEVLDQAGHVPQLERLDIVPKMVTEFLA